MSISNSSVSTALVSLTAKILASDFLQDIMFGVGHLKFSLSIGGICIRRGEQIIWGDSSLSWLPAESGLWTRPLVLRGDLRRGAELRRAESGLWTKPLALRGDVRRGAELRWAESGLCMRPLALRGDFRRGAELGRAILRFTLYRQIQRMVLIC